jgi:SAM-dependent methyltransferase
VLPHPVGRFFGAPNIECRVLLLAMPHPLIPPLADALEDWRQRIVGNRAQVERVREVADGSDFYAPVTRAFRAPDPRQQHEPTLEMLRSLLRPGDSVLDIGAGGGRYALPLALEAAEVLAVDPSEAMLRTLQDGAAQHRIQNVRAIHSAWPMTDPPGADITLAANVLYDIDGVEAFLAAMEASARRLCVLVMAEETPPTPIDRLWPEVHGEDRVELPALPELLALLLARETLFDVTLTERPSLTYERPEDALAQARRHTWVRPDGEKDRHLQAILRERMVERDGRYAFAWEPVRIGVVSWNPH